jgi:mannose PTS system EIIA component
MGTMSSRSNRTIAPMVGVVVVAHEQVAFSLIEAARRVVGVIPNLAVACVSSGEETSSARQQVAQAGERVDEGAGVLLLVEADEPTALEASMTMADGTPAAEVVGGVSLPMLLKLATLDRCRLSPARLADELRSQDRAR